MMLIRFVERFDRNGQVVVIRSNLSDPREQTQPTHLEILVTFFVTIRVDTRPTGIGSPSEFVGWESFQLTVTCRHQIFVPE